MNKDKVSVKDRLTLVAEVDNIKFFNDSRACSPDATKWALTQIDSPVVLIAGGKDINIDFSAILDQIRKKVKGIILIGEAAEKIRSVFKRLTALDEAGSMEEAVDKAFHKAKPGDCVLLSPMCPSFDMFLDYEDRGRRFKEAVYGLAEGKK